MSQIADFFLAAGALGAGFYCYILSRRLRKLNDLERGVGGAVALLSAQVDDLTRALSGAQTSARQTRTQLADQIRRAEATAQRLELLVASVQDVSIQDLLNAAEAEAVRQFTSAVEPEASNAMEYKANHKEEGAQR